MTVRRTADGDQEQPKKSLTIRVSRDGGRTYGPPVEVDPDRDCTPEITSQWPLCRCPGTARLPDAPEHYGKTDGPSGGATNADYPGRAVLALLPDRHHRPERSRMRDRTSARTAPRTYPADPMMDEMLRRVRAGDAARAAARIAPSSDVHMDEAWRRARAAR